MKPLLPKHALSLVHIICLWLGSVPTVVVAIPRSLTLWVVVDGLTSEHVDREMSTLSEFADSGLKVTNIVPTFPTSWYPNVASMATGLYADKHNILDEEIFSQELQTTLRANDAMFWNSTRNAKTIWDLFHESENYGVTHIIGLRERKLIFNPEIRRKKREISGNDSPVDQPPEAESMEDENVQEEFVQSVESEENEPLEEQLDREYYDIEGAFWEDNLLSDMKKVFKAYEEKRVHLFVTAFIREPGRSIKAWGTSGASEQLQSIDSFFYKLRDVLESEGLWSSTNIIVSGTPGYIDVDENSLISLKNPLLDKANTTGNSPVLQISPLGTAVDGVKLCSELSQFEKSNQNFQMFTREELPDRWHIRNSSYASPLVLVANPGKAFDIDMRERIGQDPRPYDILNKFGVSGYDNSVRETHPVLIGVGPDFHKNHVNKGEPTLAGKVLKSVDVFALLVHILKLSEHILIPKDAKIDGFVQYLTKPPPGTFDKIIHTMSDAEHLPLTLSLAISCAVLLTAILCILFARRRHKRQLLEQGFRYSQVHYSELKDIQDTVIQ